jgi:YVTN family beta-propeller protein
VNYGSDSVTVIDGVSDSVITTIKVGARPQAVAVDPSAHRVYVANTHDNTVSVVDGETNAVVATIKAGNGPYAIAVDSATHTAFVSNMAGPSPTVIDGRTLTESTAAVSVP